MAKQYQTTSTSWTTADAEPVVLRETSTTRLVFKPTILENPNNPAHSVRGYLCWERKKKSGEWEPWTADRLSSLTAGEGIQIELKSEATAMLFEALRDLYEIANGGVAMGTATFAKVDGPLLQLVQMTSSDLAALADADAAAGGAVLGKLAKWLAARNAPEDAVAALVEVDDDALKYLSAASGASALIAALDAWKADEDNPSEDFWQKFFIDHQFVLSTLFGYPIAVVREKAYLGGTQISGNGANLLDILAKNAVTDHALLIEIKTPKAKLLQSSPYRKGSGVYAPSPELTGAVIQVLNYRTTFNHEYLSLQAKAKGALPMAIHPPCVVIAGSTKQLDDDDKVKSFELFRAQHQDVTIVTYDELYSRAAGMVTLFLDGVS